MSIEGASKGNSTAGRIEWTDRNRQCLSIVCLKNDVLLMKEREGRRETGETKITDEKGEQSVRG